MFDPQVVDYIKKALAAGQTTEQIKKALLENGWSEMEINENILEANPPKVEISEPTVQGSNITKPTSAPAEPASKPQPTPVQSFGEIKPEIKPEPKIETKTEPVQPQAITEPKLQPRPEPEIENRFAITNEPVLQPEVQKQPQIEPKLDLKTEPLPQSNYVPGYTAEEATTPSASPTQSTYTYQHQPKARPEDKAQGRGIKILISLAVIIMIVALGGAGFIYFKPLDYIQKLISPSIVQVTPGTTETVTETTPTFASYNIKNTSFTASLPDYTINLTELTNLSNFETAIGTSFTDKQKTSLIDNNFFIASNFDKFYSSATTDYADRNDDWTGLYKTIGGTPSVSTRAPENSIFISSDYLTHIYHKLLEQEFSYTEELNLYPAFSALSNSLLSSTLANLSTATDPLQQASYERLSAYFLVSSAILNNASADYQTFSQNSYIDDTKTDTKAAVLELLNSLADENGVSENAKSIAEQEVGLIFDASRFATSPLMGTFQPNTQEDYTQYTPRSHYSKNVIFRDYFRAMIWFGRMNFLLNSTELTRDSANVALLMTADDLKKWESIYQPTSFLVGQSDDLTIYDLNKAIKATSFSTADESDQAIAKLQTELLTYSNPKIMSSVIISESVLNTTKEDLQNSTKGFRFMGQRFTPDAFIFSELTQGDETADPTTGQKLPSTPTALMVSTLMGDVVSKDLLNTWIATNAKDSDKVLANKMATLQNYFDTTSSAQWTSNIYWSWIYTIKSLFTSADSKTGYPMFMKSNDWNKKQTQTFLGSWTELKHDTLLYAKQSYAEKGAGGDETEVAAVPKGYVEPNVAFLDRLIALVNMTTEGLDKFNLMPEAFKSRNSTFVESLEFFKKIAVSELQNETISDDDFEQLRLSAYSLDQILQAPDSQVQLESNARSALIADVHTDVVKNQILYEADGIPNYVYVAVKDANGTRLTKGLVYSYYEFTNPVSTRLTDETWQKWNYSSTIKLLKMPDWSKALIK